MLHSCDARQDIVTQAPARARARAALTLQSSLTSIAHVKLRLPRFMLDFPVRLSLTLLLLQLFFSHRIAIIYSSE